MCIDAILLNICFEKWPDWHCIVAVRRCCCSCWSFRKHYRCLCLFVYLLYLTLVCDRPIPAGRLRILMDFSWLLFKHISVSCSFIVKTLNAYQVSWFDCCLHRWISKYMLLLPALYICTFRHIQYFSRYVIRISLHFTKHTIFYWYYTWCLGNYLEKKTHKK